MADDALIVPVVVPSGSLHFATVSSAATIQDVQDYLTANEDVTTEILQDLEPYGWAMQRIRTEHSGRQWEEEELEALGNGACSYLVVYYATYIPVHGQVSSLRLIMSLRC